MGGLYSKVVWGVEDVPELIVPVTLSPQATMPDYATTGAAGMTLHAAERVELHPGKPTLVDTGISLAMPFMLYGQIQGRSRMVLDNGIYIGSTVIDTDHRDTIKVMVVYNHPAGVAASKTHHVVEQGDAIAQLLVLPVARPGLRIVDALPPIKRDGIVVAQPTIVGDPSPLPLAPAGEDDDKENRPLVCTPGERV